MLVSKSRDRKQILRHLCVLFLISIPISMAFSPVFSFQTADSDGLSWTVTTSLFIFLLPCLPFLLVSLFFLKSRRERLFLISATIIIVYAYVFTYNMSTVPLYPMFSLTSASGATLVAVLFYVTVRDGMISRTSIFYVLSASLFLVVLPVFLVLMYPDKFAPLAEEYGATLALYGYQNPRALGWIAAIGLSLASGYLLTQPKEMRIDPVLLLLTLVASATLFWSGSRGGVAALALGIFFVFFFSQTKNYKGLLFVFICITIGSVIGSNLYLTPRGYGIFGRLIDFTQGDDLNNYSSGRLELWRGTFAIILERPLSGYGYTPRKDVSEITHWSAHNLFLDLWLWFGFIVGTIIGVASVALWVVTFVFFRKANDHYTAGFFCTITTMYAYSLISVPHTRTFPLILVGIACGALLGYRASKAR